MFMRSGEPVTTVTTDSHPTIAETALRLWSNLPSLWKVLIPAVGVLLVVLLPANLMIGARFYAITTDNLRAQHQAILADIGNALDDFIGKQTSYLVTLANSDAVKACAAQGCTSEAQSLFGAELSAKLREPGTYTTEIGFIDLNGKQTARAIRGSGGTVAAPGDSPLSSADPASLAHADAGQVYVFPITRDTRLSAVESYQQPVLRLAMPVIVGSERQGYVTTVVGLDDFFTQNFVYSDQYQTFLLDTSKCLLASSDDTRRADLYKTWSGDPGRTCYTDLQLEDWDTTVQSYRDTVLSTRVVHGSLSTSDQTWTIVVQQPTALAYAQANILQMLLIGAHGMTILLVVVLLMAADRATRRLLTAAQRRNVEHARDVRFNPYVVGDPIEDRQKFFGRTDAMAQVIGAGVMGGDDVLIGGDRRIGKTSLLRQVERRLRERQVSDPTYWYWPVALSLQGVPASMFYETLMERILRDIEDHTSRTNLRYHRRSDHYGVEDFREDIAEVLELPNASGRQTRMVLCLDNIHLWFDGLIGYDRAFVDTFREMLADVGNQLKMIATGTRIPDDGFDQPITIVTLGPLDADETRRLIRQPVAGYYTFSDEAVDRILVDSDCLPMEVQRLARHAVQIMLEQDAESITAAHAELARQQAIADWETTYRLLWHGGTDKDGKVIAPFNDELCAALLVVSAHNAVIPPEMWSGATPLIARSQLDDIAYTDAQGDLRLTSIFREWLAQSAR
jgi:hypothetical protein